MDGRPPLDPRRLRRRLLLEPILVILAANVGMFVAAAIQTWGTNHLGWFNYRCTDLGRPGYWMAACMAPRPTPGWALAAMAIGAVVGAGLWIVIRLGQDRRRAALQMG